MCQATSVNHIEDVVKEWMNQERMFTAFEVSREVQKRAKQFGHPVERHRNMRDEIHHVMSLYILRGVYDKTMKNIAPNVDAFIFHHVDDDPDEYQNSVIISKNNQSKPAVTAPVQSIQQSLEYDEEEEVEASVDDGKLLPLADGLLPLVSNNNNVKSYSPDARGSLTIPAAMLQSIGIVEGDKAKTYSSIDSNGDNILQVSTANDIFYPARNSVVEVDYTVNKSGNFRVTKSTLSKAGLKGPNYQIKEDLFRNVIVVKDV